MLCINFLKKALLLLLIFNASAQHNDFDNRLALFERMKQLKFKPSTKICNYIKFKENEPLHKIDLQEKNVYLPSIMGKNMLAGCDSNIMMYVHKFENGEHIRLLRKFRLNTKTNYFTEPSRFCMLYRLTMILSNNLVCNKKGSYEVFKRGARTIRRNQRRFIPSISPGAMTHLGDFFKGLSNNVNFSENTMLGKGESRLLSGSYPLHMINEEISSNGQENPVKAAEFLHAIRSYRPTQKIRSLISLTPPGYHASHFIDPNYMWVGLGK